jgi:hypothetical protein
MFVTLFVYVLVLTIFVGVSFNGFLSVHDLTDMSLFVLAFNPFPLTFSPCAVWQVSYLTCFLMGTGRVCVQGRI